MTAQLALWSAAVTSEMETKGKDTGVSDAPVAFLRWVWQAPWLLPDGRVIVRLPCRDGVGGYGVLQPEDECAEVYRIQLERCSMFFFQSERLAVRDLRRAMDETLAEAAAIVRGETCPI